MVKGNYDARNYIYVLSTIDDFEHIIEIADTQKDLANILGIHFTSISHFFNRHERNKNILYIKGRKVERVKIYDYVYIVYENDISSPLYVSRDLNNISKMTTITLPTLSGVLHNRMTYDRKRKHSTPHIHKLQGKYFIKQVDLLDLDINLANYLESCIDKGKISKSLADFENMGI